VGLNRGIAMPQTKKFLEFVLHKLENVLPVPSETILMQAFEVTVLPYIIFHIDISKPQWLGCQIYIMKGYFFIAGLH
jgi:hypothetical protein